MSLFDFDSNPTKRRRQINLGGLPSATPASDILNDAKLRRSQRQDQKRKQDSATSIQSWWRAVQSSRDVKRRLRERFVEDVGGLDGLRCLVLLGQDEEMLGMWSFGWTQYGRGMLDAMIFRLIQLKY